MIRNKAFMQQIKDLSSLRFGSVSPTDIDGFLDFGNRVFIFIEVKFGGGMPPLGQRLALERLCDSCNNGEKKAYLLIASHNKSYDEDIDIGGLQVTHYRYNGRWLKPRSDITV